MPCASITKTNFPECRRADIIFKIMSKSLFQEKYNEIKNFPRQIQTTS